MTSQEVAISALKQCCKDNSELKKAGCALAEAAMRVIGDYDGLHRLSLAVSNWAQAIANEGGRAERYKEN